MKNAVKIIAAIVAVLLLIGATSCWYTVEENQ